MQTLQTLKNTLVVLALSTLALPALAAPAPGNARQSRPAPSINSRQTGSAPSAGQPIHASRGQAAGVSQRPQPIPQQVLWSD